jgi:hypothetical protein
LKYKIIVGAVADFHAVGGSGLDQLACVAPDHRELVALPDLRGIISAVSESDNMVIHEASAPNQAVENGCANERFQLGG